MDGACCVSLTSLIHIFCYQRLPILVVNVRTFWVRAMVCMCAQTRPWSILSPERAFTGIGSEPMLNPRENSPLKEAEGRVEPVTLHQAGQSAQHTVLATGLFGPLANVLNDQIWQWGCSITRYILDLKNRFRSKVKWMGGGTSKNWPDWLEISTPVHSSQQKSAVQP